jgi:CheY-like chemotaxis protein
VPRVLVVEDDLAIQMLITETLRTRGYDTVTAADGPSGLAAAREHHPDLVLLDIGLPGMDGFEVLDHLKADEELRDVPVIMVTAWAEPEQMEQALEAGALDYVRKPFNIDDLLERVDIATRHARPQD